ncbi:Nitroreductase [Sporobacter termitidis DSM 10068]|uniref:Nitroreductase n=1 Tax=Sporobacter termitidis DSM 10068 TaxID=1123282 RepID=A0A1M5WJ88_9FIRM|nr:nitroreductase family protein [Sporobacter termitidis]SHH87223.1 Nitroreductase [Sporobacter termitidis DSM 10068]
MAESGLIRVDQEKCTRCGLCVNVCRSSLAMGACGPEVIGDYCIACGHCVAVCPNGALDHGRAPLEKQIPLEESPAPDAGMAARFLRSRRSVRTFRDERVPRESIRRLLDVARFAPTACNSQGVAYLAVDAPGVLKDVSAVIADWAEADLEHGALGRSPWSRNTAKTIQTYRESGKDTILRGAPCLVVALAEKSMAALGRDNTHFALTYAQLLAPSLGLGTCWSGLLEYCTAAGYPPLLELIKLPESKTVTGAMLVGYPVYSFRRLVDREPLQLSWLS